MPLSSANHSYQRLHDMKTPPWWAATQASPDFKNIELQKHTQTMITMFEGPHWQHHTAQEKIRTKSCATWIWQGLVLWPQACIICHELQHFLNNIHSRQRLWTLLSTWEQGGGMVLPLCSAPTESLLLLSPRWREPAENSSMNAQTSELTSKWKTTVCRVASGHQEMLITVERN